MHLKPLSIVLAALCCAASQPGGGQLVTNGGFEAADPDHSDRPLGWDRPDGLGVQWIEAPRAADAGVSHGKAICMDTTVSERAMVARWRALEMSDWDIPKPAENPIAATYGLSYYSSEMPVTSGQAYRVSFDFRSDGGSSGGKLWVRGYGVFRGRQRRRYETIVNCRVSGPEWTHFAQTFHPTRMRPGVTTMKIMLYAYWPPDRYWFDNVRIEPVPPDVYEKERNGSAPPPTPR